MRYNTIRDFGGKEPETRREYNARFGQPTGPEVYVPSAFTYIWEWFWSLTARRQSSAMGGVQPLTFVELQAWSQLMRLDIREEEVQLVLKMDAAYSAANSEEQQSISVRAREKQAPKAKRRFAN